jgi:D-lactate dehydrogenase
MDTIVYSTKSYDRTYLEEANQKAGHNLLFVEAALSEETAGLAKGRDAACIFVNDRADRAVLTSLCEGGTRFLALRCAGFNNVDLPAVKDLGMCVVRVPAYSPYAVAEHTVALMQTLNRKIHRAYNRIREGNFALQGLLGFDLHGKTVGVIGTGRIGAIVARILRAGYGCEVLAYDVQPQAELEKMGVRYASRDEVISRCDVLTLHCPLTPETHHLINADTIKAMKPGVMIVNTSRGGLVDTAAVIDALKDGRIGSLAIDVYEEEADLFFEDLSGTVIRDDVFARLTTLPNVLITGHQAYFTEEALRNIADTTIGNLTEYEKNHRCVNAVHCDRMRRRDGSRGCAEKEVCPCEPGK